MALLCLAAFLAAAAAAVPGPTNNFCYNITDRGCHTHVPTYWKAGEPGKRVLIVGDSVSMGWTPILAQLLAPKNIIVRHVGQTIPTLQNCTGTQPDNGCGVANAGNSCRGFECVSVQEDVHCGGGSCWLGGATATWDLIMFNFGLHDIERQTNSPQAPRAVPTEFYEQLLANMTATLQTKTSRLVFITTTPMPEDWDTAPYRSNSDVEAYNAAAVDIAHSAGVPVADLYAFVDKHCGAGYTSCDWQTAPPHFPGHYDPLAGFISDAVLQYLPV